jgi:hypothetical protein
MKKKTDHMTRYTAWCECWDDIVTFNRLARKTFGVQFAPEIRECWHKGEHNPGYGFKITWRVDPRFARITPAAIRQMCEGLEYGYHIQDSLKVKAAR